MVAVVVAVEALVQVRAAAMGIRMVGPEYRLTSATLEVRQSATLVAVEVELGQKQTLRQLVGGGGASCTVLEHPGILFGLGGLFQP